MSMNNKANRKAKRGKVKLVRHSFEGGIDQLLDRMKQFSVDVKKTLEAYEAKLNMVTAYVVEHVKILGGNQEIFQEFHDKLDTNVLSAGRMIRDLYGRLEQVDEVFKQAIPDQLDKINLDDELLRNRAQETYATVLTESMNIERQKKADAIKRVLEERKVAAEAEAAKAEIQAAAEKAAVDVKEKETVEAALKEAETPAVIDSQAGGPGADIPEGAQVFGG